MKLSKKGAAFIAEFEGLELKAYQDTGGVWTIGYGHTGPEVRKGLVWTKEQALQAFEKDAKEREAQLTRMLGNCPTTQNQFDALLSLGYNIGMYALEHKSTAFKEHCAGHYNRAAAAFMNWVKDNGKIIGGLVRRRQAERAMYLGED